MRSLVPPEDLIVANGIGVSGTGVSIAEEFERIGDGIVGNMIRQAFIRPDSRVLDVGCGLGRLARPLTSFLTNGTYDGLDIVESSVEWCRENYSGFENFHFHLAHLFSSEYNRTATTRASEYRFPFADATFDFVMSTSLFTHMLIDEVENYVGEMARVLKRGGRSWNTFLLMDDVAAELVQMLDGSTRWYLPYEIDGGRVRDPANPSAQIAFFEDRIRASYRRAGLTVTDVRYGPWSGRTDDVRAGGQDVVIAEKP